MALTSKLQLGAADRGGCHQIDRFDGERTAGVSHLTAIADGIASADVGITVT